jgi:hypothetical protein
MRALGAGGGSGWARAPHLLNPWISLPGPSTSHPTPKLPSATTSRAWLTRSTWSPSARGAARAARCGGGRTGAAGARPGPAAGAAARRGRLWPPSTCAPPRANPPCFSFFITPRAARSNGCPPSCWRCTTPTPRSTRACAAACRASATRSVSGGGEGGVAPAAFGRLRVSCVSALTPRPRLILPPLALPMTARPLSPPRPAQTRPRRSGCSRRPSPSASPTTTRVRPGLLGWRAASARPLAAGCWLLAAGCWPLAARCRLLVAGCWPLAARPAACQPRPPLPAQLHALPSTQTPSRASHLADPRATRHPPAPPAPSASPPQARAAPCGLSPPRCGRSAAQTSPSAPCTSEQGCWGAGREESLRRGSSDKGAGAPISSTARGCMAGGTTQLNRTPLHTNPPPTLHARPQGRRGAAAPRQGRRPALPALRAAAARQGPRPGVRAGPRGTAVPPPVPPRGARVTLCCQQRARRRARRRTARGPRADWAGRGRPFAARGEARRRPRASANAPCSLAAPLKDRGPPLLFSTRALHAVRVQAPRPPATFLPSPPLNERARASPGCLRPLEARRRARLSHACRPRARADEYCSCSSYWS